MEEIGEGDIGTVITLKSNISLTDFSAVEIRYEKSDKTRGAWTSTISGNNITYTTASGDIADYGVWILQGYGKSVTWEGVSDQIQIKVIENLI